MIFNRPSLTIAFTALSLLAPVPLASAGFRFAESTQLVGKSPATAAVSAFTGAPDSPSSGGGGTTWGGLGNGFVLYDFASTSAMSDLITGGEGIVDVVGPDIVIFEAASGTAESDLIRVEVSNDKTTWTDITSTRGTAASGFPDLPQTAHPLQYASYYNIAAHGPVARYLRITGTSASSPGQTSTAGNGFDLDAVARAVPVSFTWTGGQTQGGLLPTHSVHSAWFRSGRHVAIQAWSGPENGVDRSGWYYWSRRAESVDPYTNIPTAPQDYNFDVYPMRAFATACDGERLLICALREQAGGRLFLQVREYDDRLVPLELWGENLPAAYLNATADVAVAIGPDGRPLVLLTGGTGQSRLMQGQPRRAATATGFNSFTTATFKGAVEVPLFGSGSDSNPAIAIGADGVIRMLLTNRSLVTLNPIGTSTQRDRLLLFQSGFASDGTILTPALAAPSTQAILDVQTTSSAVSFDNVGMALGQDSRAALVFRDRRTGGRAVTLVRQTGAASWQEIPVPGADEGGVAARIALRQDGGLAFAWLSQVPGDAAYPVYGEYRPASAVWRLSRLTDPSEVPGVALSLGRGDCPLLTFLEDLPGLTVSQPEARVPLDCTDADNDGYTHLEEEALLDRRRPVFALTNSGGERYPSLVFPFPAGGKGYGRNRYTTPTLRYEVEMSLDLKNWSSILLDAAGPDIFTVNGTVYGTFQGVLKQDGTAGRRQYMRIKVSRP